MARKRVNKNLVVLLTLAGVVLTVLVVAVGTYQGTRRDPEVYAQAARELEQAGEWERAVERYDKAYKVNKEVKYLMEASRCAYQVGDVAMCLGLLKLTNSQEPANVEVIEAYLNRLWELYDLRRYDWSGMRDFSAQLVQIDPDNINGLICRAVALEALADQDPTYPQQAADALQRAIELNPTAPRVALTRAGRKLREANLLAAQQRAGTAPHGAAATIGPLRDEAVALLRESLAAHPDEPQLVVSLYAALAQAGRIAEGREVLSKGVETIPNDAELHLVLGRELSNQIRGQLFDPEASRETVQTLVAQARRNYRDAVRLEPAMYEGYIGEAETHLLDIDQEADHAADVQRRFTGALQVYQEATGKTIGLRSLRAAIGEQGRQLMLFSAFETALNYFVSTEDTAQKTFADEQALAFLERMKTRFPESHMLYFMQGRRAAVLGDARTAIQDFLIAEEKSAEVPGMLRRIYEQLAELYRDTRSDGLALQYVEKAVALHRTEGNRVPTRLMVTKAALLSRLEQPQAAYDIATVLRRNDPENGFLIRLEAAALMQLGRKQEAEALMADLPQDVQTLMTQARMAIFNEDYAVAEESLRKVLTDDPQHHDAIRLIVSVMESADRREPALELIRELADKTQDAVLKRQLGAYEIRLATTDPEEREARVLELARAIPDPLLRAAELFAFHNARQRFDQAAPYLDELEAAQPHDPGIHERQFILALNRKQFDRAERYAARLAEVNDDFAGGAVFRGQLALARGDKQGAIEECRSAEAALPKDPAAKVRLASALLAPPAPQYQEAIEKLKAALELNPRDFMALKLISSAYDGLNLPDEGVAYLERARQLNPNDPYIQAKSQLLDEEANPRQSIARRQQTRREQPDDVANLIRLGELYDKVGEQPKADECYQAAAAIEPGNPTLAQRVSEFYPGTATPEVGERLLRGYLAAQQEEQKIHALILLAGFFEMTGDQAAARDTYLEACRLVDQEVHDPEQRRLGRVLTAFQLANFYERSELFKEMIDTYRGVIEGADEQSPKDLVKRARLKMINGMLRTRRYGDAAEALETFTKLHPNDADGMALQAQLLVARNEPEEARRWLTLVLQQRPDHAWALFTRGAINFSMGDYTQARDDLLEAKRVLPDGFDLAHRRNLAEVYRALGRVELAEAELREILALRPDDSTVAMSLLTLFRDAGHNDKAEQIAAEFMARQPDNAFWPQQLGLMFLERGEYSAAVRHLEAALGLLGPARPSTLVASWLHALTKANRAPEAITAFEALGPLASPIVRVAAARAYRAAGQPERAMSEFERAATEASEESLPALHAVTARMAEDIAEAEVCAAVKRLIERPDAGPEAVSRLRCVLGTHYTIAGQAQEAADAVAPVVAAESEGSPIRLQALLVRAQARHQLKDMDGMVADYEQVLRFDEGNVQALNNLAYALAEDFDRPKLALEYAERASRVAGESAHVLDTVGWVYFLNDRQSEAERALEAALRLDAEYTAAYLHLGQVRIKEGRRLEARTLLERALELARRDKDDDSVRKAEDALRNLP